MLSRGDNRHSDNVHLFIGVDQSADDFQGHQPTANWSINANSSNNAILTTPSHSNGTSSEACDIFGSAVDQNQNGNENRGGVGNVVVVGPDENRGHADVQSQLASTLSSQMTTRSSADVKQRLISSESSSRLPLENRKASGGSSVLDANQLQLKWVHTPQIVHGRGNDEDLGDYISMEASSKLKSKVNTLTSYDQQNSRQLPKNARRNIKRNQTSPAELSQWPLPKPCKNSRGGSGTRNYVNLHGTEELIIVAEDSSSQEYESFFSETDIYEDARSASQSSSVSVHVEAGGDSKSPTGLYIYTKDEGSPNQEYINIDLPNEGNDNVYANPLEASQLLSVRDNTNLVDIAAVDNDDDVAVHNDGKIPSQEKQSTITGHKRHAPIRPNRHKKESGADYSNAISNNSNNEHNKSFGSRSNSKGLLDSRETSTVTEGVLKVSDTSGHHQELIGHSHGINTPRSVDVGDDGSVLKEENVDSDYETPESAFYSGYPTNIGIATSDNDDNNYKTTAIRQVTDRNIRDECVQPQIPGTYENIMSASANVDEVNSQERVIDIRSTTDSSDKNSINYESINSTENYDMFYTDALSTSTSKTLENENDVSDRSSDSDVYEVPASAFEGHHQEDRSIGSQPKSQYTSRNTLSTYYDSLYSVPTFGPPGDKNFYHSHVGVVNEYRIVVNTKEDNGRATTDTSKYNDPNASNTPNNNNNNNIIEDATISNNKSNNENSINNFSSCSSSSSSSGSGNNGSRSNSKENVGKDIPNALKLKPKLKPKPQLISASNPNSESLSSMSNTNHLGSSNKDNINSNNVALATTIVGAKTNNNANTSISNIYLKPASQVDRDGNANASRAKEKKAILPPGVVSGSTVNKSAFHASKNANARQNDNSLMGRNDNGNNNVSLENVTDRLSHRSHTNRNDSSIITGMLNNSTMDGNYINDTTANVDHGDDNSSDDENESHLYENVEDPVWKGRSIDISFSGKPRDNFNSPSSSSLLSSSALSSSSSSLLQSHSSDVISHRSVEFPKPKGRREITGSYETRTLPSKTQTPGRFPTSKGDNKALRSHFGSAANLGSMERLDMMNELEKTLTLARKRMS